jgi:hypothetical protein
VDGSLLVYRKIELGMAAAVTICAEESFNIHNQHKGGTTTHISLNLVLAFGATMISGGVGVVQLTVLDNAEQL